MDPGKRTFYLGRYNCIEQLGTGPIGETYRAKIYGVAGFEKQFAVKRLYPQLSEDEAFVARFVQAASAFAALDHQGIARVHEVNAQGAHYYIVVDLVRGLDLRRLLDLLQQRGEALSADAAMTVAVEIAQALDHAHGKTNVLPGGVLHLGLTVPSVMVTYEGDVKLVDVGLLAALMRPGWSDNDALASTLAYLPPEVWRGEGVDVRADVFSLGVVLHEMLGGGRVFLSDRTAELRKAIEGGPPPPPPADPRLQQIVTRALEPDPGRRFANIAEMRAAIQAVVGGRIERARADLSALVRRLAAPRERRTGAFAAVTLLPSSSGMTSPVTATKPPPIPPTPHAWAPPVPKPPVGGSLSPIPVHNTLAGIGPDDQALVPIELIELPGLPTEKGMPTVSAEDAETNRIPRAEPERPVPPPTPPPIPPAPPPIPLATSETVVAAAAPETTRPSATVEVEPSTAAAASAPSAPNGEATQEASWMPPTLPTPPPSPEPLFAEPQAERPEPVEPAKSTVPGVKLPRPGRGGGLAVLGGVALLAAVGGLAIYAGLSGNPQPTTTASSSAGTNQPSVTAPVVAEDLAHAAEATPDLAMAVVRNVAPTPTPGTSVTPKPAPGPTVAPTPPPAPTTPPAPTPAPTPGPGETTFAVASTPDGATVFVDGEAKGTTPAQVAVAPGRHKLVVLGEGQKMVKREIDVAPGGHLELTLEAAKLSSSIAGSAGLKVRCKTHGEFRIFVDDEDSGRTCPNDERISVAPGTHKVGLYSARTGELHEAEHEVTEGNNSTRVYVRY
jgi:serine/threonine protein kinase